MIQLENLGFGYPRGEQVLHALNLRLGRSRTLGLVGENGSGKSTLLACLAGLYSPSRGKVRIANLTSPGEEKKIRRKVGLVLQDSDLQILGATVGEDLTLGSPPQDLAARDRARHLAERFGLGSLWDAPVQTLSWGQKRKLCVLGILITEPQVLLLDEPFSGLDYQGILEMRQILRDRRSDKLTQVLASHDLEPMADLVDEWAVLHQGSLVLSGDSGRVFPGLRQFGVRPPSSWDAGLGVQPWDWRGDEPL